MNHQKLTFHFGWHETFLFPSIGPATQGQFFGLLLFIFLLSVLHQGLIRYLVDLVAPKFYGFNDFNLKTVWQREFFYLWRAGVTMMTSFVGYLLMLAVMSFNAAYLISVLMGIFFGNFIFRPEHQSKMTDLHHC